MKYKSVVVQREGGPEVMQVMENDLRAPCQEGDRIKPIIRKKYPLLEAAQANTLLESGEAIGNDVLVTMELLQFET